MSRITTNCYQLKSASPDEIPYVCNGYNLFETEAAHLQRVQ